MTEKEIKEELSNISNLLLDIAFEGQSNDTEMNNLLDQQQHLENMLSKIK